MNLVLTRQPFTERNLSPAPYQEEMQRLATTSLPPPEVLGSPSRSTVPKLCSVEHEYPLRHGGLPGQGSPPTCEHHKVRKDQAINA